MSNIFKVLATKFYMWAFNIRPSNKIKANKKKEKGEKEKDNEKKFDI